ncbi:hypothetical protein [Pseudoalteromonas denitrificans]|nr:hypothetical protein [Pseudoalteromonas denitrificans]
MKPKTPFQKISYVFSILFFIGAALCTLWIIIYGESTSSVYKASFAASAFFCFTSALVLITMAKANLPNLKFDTKDKTNL